MKKNISILLLFITINTICSQEYFSKLYDAYGHNHDIITALDHINDDLYIWGAGGCTDKYIACHKFMNTDVSGNVIEVNNKNNFFSGRYPIVEDSIYFIGGRIKKEKLALYKSTLTGDSISLMKLRIDNDGYYNYHQGNIVAYNDQILVMGQVRDSLDENRLKGVIFWVNRDMTLDTITIIAPETSRGVTMGKAVIDPDGNVVVSMVVQKTIFGSILHDFVTIYKYNKKKEVVFEWESKPHSGGVPPALAITPDGMMITKLYDRGYSEYSIIAINPEGTIAWEYQFDDGFNEKVYNITDILILESGEIVGSGAIDYLSQILFRTGFIFKLSADGVPIWERIFRVEGNHPLYDNGFGLLGELETVIELENGDIASGGYMYNYKYNDSLEVYMDDIDMWLLKVDEHGCLAPDCGEIQQIGIAGFVNYHNEWRVRWGPCASYGARGSNRYRFFKEDRIWINGEYYSEMNISNTESGEYHKNGELYIQRDDKVYMYNTFTESDELLYDFGLAVGDTFNSTFFEKEEVYLEVIAVDTIVLLDENPRRQLTLRYKDTIHTGYWEYEWIEGIGDPVSFLGHMYTGVLYDGCYTELMCFSSIGQLVYENTKYDNCWYTVGIEDIPEDALSIAPNPASDYIEIITDMNLEQVELYSITGKRMMSTTDHHMQISHLPAGLYILSIRLQDGRTANRKIVKN